jgi:hypothetical protein
MTDARAKASERLPFPLHDEARENGLVTFQAFMFGAQLSKEQSALLVSFSNLCAQLPYTPSFLDFTVSATPIVCQTTRYAQANRVAVRNFHYRMPNLD